MSIEACLTLREFGVAYNERTVLRSVTMTIPRRGLHVLVGPTGTGKSTLLRAIAGFHRAIPSARMWGECRYLDRPLGDGDHWPQLVVQHTRLLTSTLLDNMLLESPERFASSAEQKRERALQMLDQAGLGALAGKLNEPVLKLPLHVQRLVSIARAAAAGPALLCVDEPTNAVDEQDAFAVLEHLQREAERRAVLVVLHNQREIRRLQGAITLLASGVIQENQPIARFFAQPQSPAARQFLASGSCSEISPAAQPDELAPEARSILETFTPPPATRSAAIGPNGFVWLLPGRLGGTPQPGIQFDLEYDLEALQRVGITTLISLIEQRPDVASLARFGIRTLWRPVRDMEAPTINSAQEMCAHIDVLLAQGDAVAVHCKAGLGRTGTLLVAYLIWRGDTALTALEAARRCEPRWVQSDAQIRFLEEFARALWRTRDTAAARADPLRRADALVDSQELNNVD